MVGLVDPTSVRRGRQGDRLSHSSHEDYETLGLYPCQLIVRGAWS